MSATAGRARSARHRGSIRSDGRLRSSESVGSVGSVVLVAVIAAVAVALACGESAPDAGRPGVSPPLAHPAACPQLGIPIPSGTPGVASARAAMGEHPHSVIVVLADTLRRDRLGVYGGPAHTPAFDGFARQNLLFDSVTSQAPWTKPSIATLFTGLYPSQHGVVSHPSLRGRDAAGAPLESDVLGSDLVTLAESFSGAGYATAAFVSNPWLQADLGFAQGFDTYDDSFAANDTPGGVVTRAGLDWLAARREDPRPFFLYLHYMDVHEPYAGVSDAALEARRAAIEADRRPVTAHAREEIATRALDDEGGLLVARGVPANRALIELSYDQGVERFDHVLGELLAGLADEPSARDAAIVVTADHGEALYQRGWGSHGFGLFQDETAVPLAMHLPGVVAHGPVSCPAGLIDVNRTICDYAGLPCAQSRPGRSLLGDTGTPEETVVLSEGVIARPRHRAARDTRYKLIYEPGGRQPPGALQPRGVWSLYDLETDPDEEHDLLGGRRSSEIKQEFRRLKQSIASGIADLGRSAPEVRPLDEKTRRRLEALGYVGEPEK